MRRRGAQYWMWLDNRLPTKIYEDLLSDGREVEVQARLTWERRSQVFVGIYGANGAVFCEEFYGDPSARHSFQPSSGAFNALGRSFWRRKASRLHTGHN